MPHSVGGNGEAICAENSIGARDHDRTDTVDQAGVIVETNIACGMQLRTTPGSLPGPAIVTT
jgi:hypothetical protein